MKRHFPRFAANMPMVATVVGDREVCALQGRCTVVSEGGLGGVLPGRIPLGDVVALELHFPNSERMIRVRAAVRHSHYPHYGLEFLTLGEQQRKVIARYCEMHSRPARALFIDMIRKYFFAQED